MRTTPRFALVQEAGLAFASLGWPTEPTTMPVLVYDETQAITDVVKHLVALGHRRIESDYTAVGGRAATAQLLDLDPQPTATVYSNDLMAVAGMSAAFSRGLRVPDDISIGGWDDITISQYLHPAPSTVTQHPFDDGRVAATLRAAERARPAARS